MKVAVLLSGGVDSSVALRKAQESGYENISAWYIKVWLEDDARFIAQCPWDEDLAFAREVCQQAGVQLKIAPLQIEYYETVVQYVLAELKLGRTPSPDIFCNKRIKFDAFLKFIGNEYELIVTGHYAHITKDKKGIYHLYQAPDPVKDQSYFLSYLNQAQLSRLYFPLGNMYKNEVRHLAQKFNLPNKNRPDSQGICFLGNIKYTDFIKFYLGEQNGRIIQKSTGKILGDHRGYWFYTIGQRTGLGISGGPWYIINKNLTENILYVSHQSELEKYYSTRFICSKMNWLSNNVPDCISLDSKTQNLLHLKLRHGPTKIPCTLKQIASSNMNQEQLFEVTIKTGDKGIAPGQFAVFYNVNECLGAAVIESS